MATLQEVVNTANDGDLQQRVAASAVAHANFDPATHGDPVNWAAQNRWQIAKVTEIADAHAYASNEGYASPGKRAGAVTDAMINSAVDALLNPA